MKRNALLAACLLTSAVLAACGPSQAKLDAQATVIAASIFATQTAEGALPTTAPSSTPTPTTTSPTPSLSIGTESDPIVWVFTSFDTGTRTAVGIVAGLLHDETGLHFLPRPAQSYDEVVDVMCAIPPAAHICTLSAFHYVFAHDYCRVEAGLTGLQFGAPAYSGQIITHVDAGITSLSDLRGKIFCRVDANSTTGWILPELTMRAAGLDPSTDLARIADVDGHDTVVNAVYSGWCDAGATFVDARTLFARDHPDVMEQVFVVATTPSIPNDGIHFGPGLPRELHSTVADAFVSIAHTSEGQDALSDAFGWGGLIRQDDTVYDPLRAVLRASGTDIRELID